MSPLAPFSTDSAERLSWVRTHVTESLALVSDPDMQGVSIESLPMDVFNCPADEYGQVVVVTVERAKSSHPKLFARRHPAMGVSTYTVYGVYARKAMDDDPELLGYWLCAREAAVQVVVEYFRFMLLFKIQEREESVMAAELSGR